MLRKRRQRFVSHGSDIFLPELQWQKAGGKGRREQEEKELKVSMTRRETKSLLIDPGSTLGKIWQLCSRQWRTLGVKSKLLFLISMHTA